jgi:hypothetical protein
MASRPRVSRHVHVEADFDDGKQTAFEKMRANIPLLRTLTTATSILLSAMWLTWMGSQWVADIRSEMREIRTSLSLVTRALDDKAASKDVEHRFALMCARAPVNARAWVCNTKG